MILMFNNEIFSSAQYKQIIGKYSFLHVVTQDSCKIRVVCFVCIPCYNMKCRIIRLTLSEVRKPKIIWFTLEHCFVEVFVSPCLS